MVRRDRNAQLDAEEIEALKVTQAVITRMADNSQKTKTIFLTLGAAGIAFAGSKAIDVTRAMVIVTCVWSALLWYIDARYLWLERRFRKHYAAIVNGLPNLDAWALDISKHQESVWKVMFAFPELIYPALTAGVVVLYCL